MARSEGQDFAETRAEKSRADEGHPAAWTESVIGDIARYVLPARTYDYMLGKPEAADRQINPQTDLAGAPGTCPVGTLPNVQIDGAPAWFKQRSAAFDTDKNKALSENEIDSALKGCPNPSDRAYLDLLKRAKHSSLAAQYGLDKPNREFTAQDMSQLDSWIKSYNRESADLQKNDPADALAISYLRQNFSRLDSDHNGRITAAEVNSAAANSHPPDPGLAQLQTSFNAIAASTAPSGAKPARAEIGSKEIATFTVKRNAEARSGFPYINQVVDYFSSDLDINVFTAIEELRRQTR